MKCLMMKEWSRTFSQFYAIYEVSKVATLSKANAHKILNEQWIEFTEWIRNLVWLPMVALGTFYDNIAVKSEIKLDLE